jgi:hypothetical protein
MQWRYKLKSELPQEPPQEQPRVPELELKVVVRILKDRYSVFIEPVQEKPYYVRFRQLDTGRTIQGMTHAKGTCSSPLFILQILERFDISVPDFIDDLVEIKKGPQRI